MKTYKLAPYVMWVGLFAGFVSSFILGYDGGAIVTVLLSWAVAFVLVMV